MATNTRSVNILIDNDRFQNLDVLAKMLGISRSAVVRQLIDHCFQHLACQSPTCANGHKCFVPQMQHYGETPNASPSGQRTPPS